MSKNQEIDDNTIFARAQSMLVDGKFDAARRLCLQALTRANDPEGFNSLLLEIQHRSLMSRLVESTEYLARVITEQIRAKRAKEDPIGAFLGALGEFRPIGHQHDHYRPWRMTRIRKILEIVDRPWDGMKIVDLGGGQGDIGGLFASLGANVLSLEGRPANAAIANLRFQEHEYQSVVFDLEKDASHFGRFDLVLCLGVMEVVTNINGLMESCSRLADHVILETMVCDSLDAEKIMGVKLGAQNSDDPIAGMSLRPSPYYIEKFFESRGFEVHRHFTADLNAAQHRYDWAHKNDNSVRDGQRRFWSFKKSASPDKTASPG
jgi:2-polyprenyl-3-methyl-5-hydroxy-6-metoxy-1,4-benzoquinol methylase